MRNMKTKMMKYVNSLTILPKVTLRFISLTMILSAFWNHGSSHVAAVNSLHHPLVAPVGLSTYSALLSSSPAGNTDNDLSKTEDNSFRVKIKGEDANKKEHKVLSEEDPRGQDGHSKEARAVQINDIVASSRKQEGNQDFSNVKRKLQSKLQEEKSYSTFHLLKWQSSQQKTRQHLRIGRKLEENGADGSESSSVAETASNIGENVGEVKENVESTYRDVQDTYNTAPTNWTRRNFIIAAIVVAIAVILCGCVYRCIPCAPRII